MKYDIQVAERPSQTRQYHRGRLWGRHEWRAEDYGISVAPAFWPSPDFGVDMYGTLLDNGRWKNVGIGLRWLGNVSLEDTENGGQVPPSELVVPDGRSLLVASVCAPVRDMPTSAQIVTSLTERLGVTFEALGGSPEDVVRHMASVATWNMVR